MRKSITAMNRSVSAFVLDEEGAQVVEYALIIAVVSIGLVLALGGGTSSLATSFTTLVSRITTCFSVAACT